MNKEQRMNYNTLLFLIPPPPFDNKCDRKWDALDNFLKLSDKFERQKEGSNALSLIQTSLSISSDDFMFSMMLGKLLFAVSERNFESFESQIDQSRQKVSAEFCAAYSNFQTFSLSTSLCLYPFLSASLISVFAFVFTECRL